MASPQLEAWKINQGASVEDGSVGSATSRLDWSYPGYRAVLGTISENTDSQLFERCPIFGRSWRGREVCFVQAPRQVCGLQ